MKKVLLVFIGLLLLSFTGCSEKAAGDEKTAEDYVKTQGYKVYARKEEIGSYTLEKNMLYGGTETIPYQQAWAVQTVEPDKYFGKEIIIYGFAVKNHPLEKFYKNAKINAYVMLSEGKVIGGYSFPDKEVGGDLGEKSKTFLEKTIYFYCFLYLHDNSGIFN